jgi:hypothetical protein
VGLNPQVIDVSGYFLDLMVQQYDMIQHLDGQPLQVSRVNFTVNSRVDREAAA